MGAPEPAPPKPLPAAIVVMEIDLLERAAALNDDLRFNQVFLVDGIGIDEVACLPIFAATAVKDETIFLFDDFGWVCTTGTSVSSFSNENDSDIF